MSLRFDSQCLDKLGLEKRSNWMGELNTERERERERENQCKHQFEHETLWKEMLRILPWNGEWGWVGEREREMRDARIVSITDT